MKRVLTITEDESLVDGLERAADLDNVAFDAADGWAEAQDRLVEESFQAVCLDYESVKIEGLQSFIELDNILQKQGTGAIILLREESSRAQQFADNFESIDRVVNLTTDDVGIYLEGLVGLLDDQADPAESKTAASEARPTVEVVLPDVREGDLTEHSVARVVHTLRRQEWSGELTLETGDMVRTVDVADGRLVVPNPESSGSFEQLQAAFAWSDGGYRFERDDSVDGATAEPYSVLLEGAQNHLDQRAAMNQLMPVMDRYVSRTSFFESCRTELEGHDDLDAFLGQADGETTAEDALSAIAGETLTGFQAGFFAIECDLVVLTEEPTHRIVQVEFSEPDVSTQMEASGGREGVSPTSSVNTAHEEPDTAEREAELRRTYERFVDAEPYQVMDLWEGCGEEEVRNRYFKLVKRHHPDSHGGNISDEGKELAEKIFIRIKQSYSELLAREDEQRVSREEAEASDTTGDSSLNESLTSPSVTAMGGDEDQTVDAPENAAGDETSNPSLNTGSPSTREMAAPAASRHLGDRETQESEPVGSDDSHTETTDLGSDSESSTKLGEEPTADASTDDNERAEKLQQLRDRVSSRDERAHRTTPVGDSNRREKLDSLRPDGSRDEQSTVERPDEPTTEEEAQECFNTGYRAFKNENEQKAYELFEKAHDFDSSNAVWKTFYAYTLWLRNPDEREEARKLLGEVITSDDKQARPDAHLFLGRIQKVRDEHERARQHFERAVELNPKSREAQRELRVYEMRDDESSDDDDSGNFFGDLFNKDIF